MTELSWKHAVRDVPQDGLLVDRTATTDEATSLAAELKVLAIEALRVRYRLAPASGDRLTLTGSIEARLTQECVVTLEPVASTVSVPLDVVFSPEPTVPPEAEGTLEDLEQPFEEPIEGGLVDVGRIVTEELLSNLDPYPRSAGASFDWKDETNAAAGSRPFAALAKLQGPDGSS